LRAVAIAVPVLEELEVGSPSPREWRVAGATSSALYLRRYCPGPDGELDELVIALTAPGTPAMPNGVGLDRVPARWPAVGTGARCSPGSIQLADDVVAWNPLDPPVWDPSVRQLAAPSDPRAVAARGRAILRACGVSVSGGDPAALGEELRASGVTLVEDPGGRRALDVLLAAVHARDPRSAALAADLLLGRGPGLTPEGDDVLCGAAATVACLGAACGFAGEQRDAWLRAIYPRDLADRTTALSATLLRLATAGNVAEPVAAVLGGSDLAWRTALGRLVQVGSSTGLAYAVAIGASAVLLAG
jgi:hypothetical protein